jgi:Niemann-Pick C1 protein
MTGLPEGADFMRYLQQWLVSPTDEACPLGGQAAYGSAVKLSSDNGSVVASHFRTFHTPLKSQADFISALAAAQRISADIEKRTGVKMFAYSLFYVFFDQYEHIVSTAVKVIALALVAILVITSILLGSWRTGSAVTTTCFLAVTLVMGIMGFWNISLNAISLVNLVISLGIAVEFCSHIARAFMGAGGLPYDKPDDKEKDVRAFTALVDVGPSVSRDLAQLNSGILRNYDDKTHRHLCPSSDAFQTARDLLLPNVVVAHHRRCLTRLSVFTSASELRWGTWLLTGRNG